MKQNNLYSCYLIIQRLKLNLKPRQIRQSMAQLASINVNASIINATALLISAELSPQYYY